jgi:hypothetical protein
MPVFVVVLTRKSDEALSRIEQIPEADRYQLKDDVWLIDHDGPTRAFAEQIGIRRTNTGATGVAFPISNYSGRTSPSVWEWLKQRVAPEEEV